MHTKPNFNSNPGGYKKRTSPGSITFISTSISKESGWENVQSTHMCRIYFYEILISDSGTYIWFYVQFILMMNCFCCENLRFKFKTSGHFSDPRVGRQYQLHATLNKSAHNPKISIKPGILLV
jgi:hypothetical protein